MRERTFPIAKISLISLLSIVLGIFFLVLFQNCGDVNIAELKEQTLVNRFSLQAHVEPIRSGFTASNRVVFIVDMSLSNLGTHLYQMRSGYTDYEHKIITEHASDLNAKRLDFIRELIEVLNSSSIRFSVIGFHDIAVLDPRVESCDSKFVSGDSILSDEIPYLIGLHNSDLNRSSGVVTQNTTSPFNMGETSYLRAFSCLEQKILKESSQSDVERPFYNVVFVTDGEPSDFKNLKVCSEDGIVDCSAELSAQVQTCRDIRNESEENICFRELYSKTIYPARLNSIKNGLIGKTMGIKFYPIYYGKEDGYVSAKSVLDELSHIFDSNIQTQKITDFSSIAETMKQTLNLQLSVPYTIENFAALNLTAVPAPDQWLADSDMNGISDRDEDRNNSSNPVTQSLPTNNIRQIFNSYRSDFNSDKDELPSFLEVIRGLSPNLADSRYLSDGDGLMMIYKVLNSLALNNSELVHPTRAELKPQFQIQQLSGDGLTEPFLGGSVYELQVLSMPWVEGVRSFLDPDSNSNASFSVNRSPSEINFSHEADENLILLIYTAVPLNSSLSKKKLFGAIVRMGPGVTDVKLTTEDFVALGDL